QAYALGFAARQRGRATVQREVAQANILQKLQPAFDLGNQVARDAGFTANEGELFNPEAHVGHREARQVGNAHAIEPDGAGLCIQARAFAAWANRVQHIVGLGLGKALFAALVVGVAYRVVKHLALLFAELDARAHAVRAPA